MIRYALACDRGHEFDSWFPSASSFDAQVDKGLVECPACASKTIRKQLMAPSVRTAAPASLPSPASDPNAPPPAPASEPAAPPAASQPVALLSERDQAMRAMLRAVRDHVTKNADYVGTGFADEARRMHYGETEHRSIYGEANALDAKALLDEGIEVHALPPAPDDRN